MGDKADVWKSKKRPASDVSDLDAITVLQLHFVSDLRHSAIRSGLIVRSVSFCVNFAGHVEECPSGFFDLFAELGAI